MDKVEVTIEKDTATDCGTGYSARATGLTGDKADNYSLVMNNPTRQTTFTIVPKKVTISADNASKTYGGDDPAQLRATILDSDNKEISDSATGYIDATNYTVERAEGEDAGTYVITVKMKDVYVENSNYDITLSTGTFTINKKPVTLSVDSNQGKIYNNDATTDKLKATVTGLVDTDKLNYNLSREDGEDADSYAIKVSLGNNPNYDVEVVNGQNFVISKAEITGVTGIKAEAKTYDGKATATLTYDDVVITGKVPGTDLGVEATGTFADNGNVECDPSDC